jgi:uncharacterized protein involved in tolerance to divalent cations
MWSLMMSTVKLSNLDSDSLMKAKSWTRILTEVKLLHEYNVSEIVQFDVTRMIGNISTVDVVNIKVL